MLDAREAGDLAVEVEHTPSSEDGAEALEELRDRREAERHVREGHLRRRRRQPSQGVGERCGRLRCQASLGARGEGCRPEPEVAIALRCHPLAEPAGRLLHASVLGQAARELLGRFLRLELRELSVLLGKEMASLDLEQSRDQDEELAARVEVDLVAGGQMLDEGDDDGGDVDLRRLQLILEDEGEKEVEGTLERVEVQLEVANGRRH